MNPTQPNVPNARELCFRALEQAYADSLATQDKMQKQINGLLHSFQQLEELMQAEKITSPSPKIWPTDLTPVWATLTGWPPPPVLPNKYDGNHSKGFPYLMPDLYMPMPRFLSRGPHQNHLGFIIYEVWASS